MVVGGDGKKGSGRRGEGVVVGVMVGSLGWISWAANDNCITCATPVPLQMLVEVVGACMKYGQGTPAAEDCPSDANIISRHQYCALDRFRVYIQEVIELGMYLHTPSEV